MTRILYLTVAAVLHALVLWGIRFSTAPAMEDEEGSGDAVEVSLVTSAEEASAPAAATATPEPPPPEPTPPPPPPTPVTPPPPDPVPEPIPPAEPQPTPPPQPRPEPAAAATPAPKRAATRTAHGNSSAKPSTAASASAGTGFGRGSGAIGPGDRPHATRVHRADLIYPRALQSAGIGGHVELTLTISGAGRLISAAVSKSSGHAELDQAAISAARASTYEPKRIGGVAMADSVTASYNFVPRR